MKTRKYVKKIKENKTKKEKVKIREKQEMVEGNELISRKIEKASEETQRKEKMK